MSKTQWTLQELLTQITQQTAVKFSVNTKKFPPEKILKLSKRKYTVYTLLEETRQTTGVNYAEFGSHIIFADKVGTMVPTSVRPSIAGLTRGPYSHRTPKSATDAKKNAAANRFAENGIREKEMAASLPAITSSFEEKSTITDSIVSISSVNNKLLTPDKPAPAILKDLSSKRDEEEKINSRPDRASRRLARSAFRAERRAESGSGYTGLFAAAGLTIDDALYAQTTILAGHTWLYAIGSVASNFRNGGPRYGLGSSVPVNHRWSIHAQFLTGGLDYKKDSLPSAPKTVTQRLNTVRLLASWKISGNLQLQFGPVLHMQHLKHDKSGSLVPFNMTESEMYDKFGIAPPLYNLTNNYDENASSFRMSWIGVQAGLFFNLNFFEQR
ncbi:hypothetical protein HHL16_22155 [Pseudoflavitalea sp. G-6-1-2]|uniref:hypothetical protein n=1 Tax=Pseudoflavitalea sp. G-6-1-2 TaxID=2728841 RepID=UPI00146AE9AE|nr:hypothetical protein [Pseudoflavitalea sp. G-6-1-2]NML23599.1 hypothetical protein [Pseudoflavitalea sp. G-6-1-2]